MKIQLTQEEMRQVEGLLQPKLQINLERRQSIFEPHGDIYAALRLVTTLAVEKGAPPLKDGQYYGLQEDGIVVGLDRQSLEIQEV